MDKIARAIFLTGVMLFLFTGVALGIDTIELNQLVENAKVMDGKTVVVQGEAIGEAMERNENAWVNINDGTNAMGIWMQSEDSEKILVFGDYKNKGDTVKVTGVFNRACVEHGGDMDIHVSSIEVVEKGHSTIEEVPLQKIIAAIVFVFFAIIVAGIYLKVMK